jgi:ABC-type phosphate transport system permease subunit
LSSINNNERHKMYNTLLYIGLTLMAVGFVGWVVSIIMERHYEVKLWELEQKRKAENGQK